MDIILIPGLWLKASSWDQVTPHLEAAGHTVHAISLPGMDSASTDRSGVTLDDAVAVVTDVIDRASDKVVVVGHSGGAGVAYGALDARVDRVARVIYVGGFPSPNGEPVVGGFAAENGEVPLPDWSVFDEADLRDLDAAALDRFRADALPSPEGLVTGIQTVSNERRYDVPATVICPEFTSEMLQGWIDEGHIPEFTPVRDLTFVDVPTGHWPQFTRPAELARAILDQPPLSGAPRA
jgi:pimeloyl-ACP methyl ester carboxylesterase